jgi:A nuclease family of the HNH/ENDO VII superfamily with conserved AHH
MSSYFTSILRRWFVMQPHSLVMFLAQVFLALALWGCAFAPPQTAATNECTDTEYAGDVQGYPLRLPDNSRLLPGGEEVPWLLDSVGAAEIRTQKHLIGQQDPTRSGIFHGARPKCPGNAVWATTTALEKEANDAGFAAGEQYGQILGRVEAGIETLQGWPHFGVSIKRILNHPEEREALFRGLAKDLEELPELPTYSAANLSRAAKAGFERGYRDGVDKAHLRAWLVNIGVDVYFMACGNIAGALETAGAKLLDKAIMRIRSMPIFVPGTVGGPGFFMNLPRPKPAGSSRELLKAMLAAGKKPLEGEVPHHLVAHSDWRAQRAREILADFGIGLDKAENGVFLPQNTKSLNPKGKAVHQTVHTNEYYKAVEKALEKANTKDEAIKELEKLAFQLEHGGLK